MQILFLSGPVRAVDEALIGQIQAADAGIACRQASSPDEALVEIWKGTGLQAVLISPQVSRNETIALIGNLRRDRVPLAIVPIVAEPERETFAAAVAAGADDVLLSRDLTLLNVGDTLSRIRQSPHLYPSERQRRLRVLYAGLDALVWSLLEQVPFVAAERGAVGIDGFCDVRTPGSEDLRCDLVVIDEQPDDGHPLQVVKSVKTQAPELPIVVLTSIGAADIATAALELGADDTVLKSGIFRRRLIATLRRALHRLERDSHHDETRSREQRLRQVVERAPCSLAVIGSEGVILAINDAGVQLLGAERTRDVVGKDFRTFVDDGRHDAAGEWLRAVTQGESSSFAFDAETLTGARVPLVARAAPLERASRGGRGMIVTFEPPRGGRPRVDESALEARLEKAHLTLTAARQAHETEVRDLRERLHGTDAAAAEWQERASRVEDARRAAEQELIALREAGHAMEQALASATSQLSSDHAVVQELEQTVSDLRRDLERAERDLSQTRDQEQATRAALHERDLLRGVLAGERQELDRMRLALEAAQAELHHTDRARALDRSEWTALRADLEQALVATRAALEQERAARASDEAERGDRGTLSDELAAERQARDREARERETLRAAFDREEAMTAARETRMAQAHQAAIESLQRREAELVGRAEQLQVALEESARRRREVEDVAETARRAIQPAAERGCPGAELLLEDTGALAGAMLPTLESLVSTLRDDEQQLRSQWNIHPAEDLNRGRYADVVMQLDVLIRQLGAFSRRQAAAGAAVDLNAAIAQAESTLVHLVGPYVGFEVRLGTATAVDVPQVDLDQLLTSLVTFGRDVLPAGGTVILDSSGSRRDADGLSRHGVTLKLIAMGYGARCPVDAPAVALSARRCGAELIVRGEHGWRAELEVVFSAFADGGRRPWTWETREP